MLIFKRCFRLYNRPFKSRSKEYAWRLESVNRFVLVKYAQNTYGHFHQINILRKRIDVFLNAHAKKVYI